MNGKISYRTTGASGALLDEYEKSIKELITIIIDVPVDDLIKIVDSSTHDEDCKSIQTILAHVVHSGYTYVIEIRNWLGEKVQFMDKELLRSAAKYKNALGDMFRYTEKLFEDYPNLELHEYKSIRKINVRWGQQYDVEQLLEHAIVHILRHRRQIQRFKEK
ncbi:DinB family protein [Marivirga sericea]|uniref:DinB family protein n=1 Tax=Marivirga sericea TaxID=1028 RepID=A0A1X7K5V0_9BACT|nr:DinB family protein [Marivirga sericea]SMG35694.1 DinB family protein [Marivirga sericea]